MFKKSLMIFFLLTPTINAKEIVVNLDDAQSERVINAFSATYGYQEYLDENNTVQNPETKDEFIKKTIIRYIKDVVRSYEANIGSEESRKNAAKKVDDEIDIR